MKAMISKHRFISFIIMTYAWSGTVFGMLFIIFPGGMEFAGGKPVDAPLLFYLFFVLGGMGPGLAAFVLTALIDGGAGIRKLLGKAAIPFNPGWLLIAVIIPLACAAAARMVMAVSGLTMPEFSLAVVLPLYIVSAAAGFLEEFGWRGFAYDAVRSDTRCQFPRNGILIGVLWGMWHVIAAYWGVGRLYGASFPLFFLFATLIPLTAYSVLMIWLIEKSRTNILSAVVFHSFLSFSAGYFLTNASRTSTTITQYAVYALFVTMCAVVCVLSGAVFRRFRR